MAYAHSRNRRGERHDLVDHLRTVANDASRFGAAFGAAEAAQRLGLWHDVGKFDPAFERYLLASEVGQNRRGRGPDHKAAGSLLAARHLGPAGLIVQGHHGGLRTPEDLQSWLRGRRDDAAVQQALAAARDAVAGLEPEADIVLPPWVLDNARAAEFFLRFLFSVLVDADYLDTERHFAHERSELRGGDVTLGELWERLERDQQRLSGRRTDAVSRVRHEVYESCVRAAEGRPGTFRLTVPTGGGKTRSGMAFALRHAMAHGLDRVIVAVPFITITEQTADVYRSIFEEGEGGRRVVLEHHSGGRGGEDERSDTDDEWARLGAENWDAPIVVTTTVQLFESLFSRGTGEARKIHRLARSVVILDEAQALPSHLLEPILDGLRELTEHYGTTVVISTATQPAFEAIPAFAAVPAWEIVPDPGRLFETLRRVRYEWQTDRGLTWQEVANLMTESQQTLAVVNTKKDALALLDALGDDTALHLSRLLCGAHRRQVLDEVRRRLRAGEPCLLVATQVVEAGVDIDFPLVLRALGPLDAIIQAAGRANREGRLEYGRVVVFRPANGGMPSGYKAGVGITGAMIGEGGLDPHDPASPREYFRRLFQTVATDGKGIQQLRAALDFPEVARRFRLIEDDTAEVVVPYGGPEQRRGVEATLRQLRARVGNARALMRELQPYLVTVRSREAQRYEQRGLIAPVLPRLGEWLGGYDPVRGLTGEDPNPELLVV